MHTGASTASRGIKGPSFHIWVWQRQTQVTSRGGKGRHGGSISSINAPSFYICGRQRRTRGEHQQHQGPFVLHLGGTNADIGGSISSMRAPSFEIWKQKRQTQGKHQQHQGPFVLHLVAAKADTGGASAAMPLRFTVGGGKGRHRWEHQQHQCPLF